MSYTLREKLKRMPDNQNVKNFKPKPKKSPEVLALEGISWQLKRIADILEKQND